MERNHLMMNEINVLHNLSNQRVSPTGKQLFTYTVHHNCSITTVDLEEVYHCGFQKRNASHFDLQRGLGSS